MDVSHSLLATVGKRDVDLITFEVALTSTPTPTPTPAPTLILAPYQVACYYQLEDYAGLEKLIGTLPDGAPQLKEIGDKFASVGMSTEVHICI